MKIALTTLILLLSGLCFSQTENLLTYDHVESYDWFGYWWLGSPTAGYFSDISVTPILSAALYGANTGSNTPQYNVYEYDWYTLPNYVVDNSLDHVFRMRLSAQSISNPLSSTAGLDAPDYIEVQLSTDGGINYISEMRITGFSNAIWDYNTNAVATKLANGSLTTFSPTAGGNRTNTGDGYSIIELFIPAGVSNIAIDIFARSNRSGEDWWMDNFELYEIEPISLPVEMLSFDAKSFSVFNQVEWVTATEYNTSHFVLERSTNGLNWETISNIKASGNSNTNINYNFIDYNENELTYYKLIQYDNDGKFEIFGPISTYRKVKSSKIIYYTDLLGKKVNPDNHVGVILEVHEDGSTSRMLK